MYEHDKTGCKHIQPSEQQLKFQSGYFLNKPRMYIHMYTHTYIHTYIHIYRVSHELRSLLRESVPYVKIYRYNPKHLCPKLNGYGDNGKRKMWTSLGCTQYTCQLAVIYVRPCVGCHVTECAFSHVSEANHVNQRSAFQCHVQCFEP